MRKVSLGRPTRSVCVSLACLSLALHLLLAFFCLSVLHTTCIPPSSSSTSGAAAAPAAAVHAAAAAVLRTAAQLRQSVLAPSGRTSSPPSLPRLPTEEQRRHQTLTLEARDAEDAKEAKEAGAASGSRLIAARKLTEEVKSGAKLEALFQHPLYNLPLPELRNKDRLLPVGTQPPDESSQSYYSSDKAE